jgi:ferric-chelate reductase
MDKGRTASVQFRQFPSRRVQQRCGFPRQSGARSVVSLASSDVSDSLGFTRQLYDQVIATKTTNIPTYLDGPYGASVDVTHYPTILGIAGGTGITHILSHAIHLLALASTRQTPLRRLHIVWNIRHASHVEWITPLLNTHFANLPSGKQLQVTIDIHVTRESVSNDPSEEPVHLGEAFEGVLEALPGHMRRERRRSMAMQMEMDDDDDDETPTSQPPERRPFLRSADSFLTEEQEVRYTKRGDRHGLSNEVWKLVKWNSGRAQLKGYVQQDVASSHGDMGMIGTCNVLQVNLSCG